MSNPFEPPRGRPVYRPRRRSKEMYFETKARVLSVLPVDRSADFEVVLVGLQGLRVSFVVGAIQAREWLNKRDAGTHVEICVRQWLRKLEEGR